MKRLVAIVLMVSAGIGFARAHGQAPSDQTLAKGANVSQQIKQIERDWADAMTSGDLDKVGQIVADDWTGIAFDGKKITKQSLLAAVNAGKNKAESIEVGPMDVKVLGSVAVVHGSDTENREERDERRS
jgi:ketosteroid isomerase-like protein